MCAGCRREKTENILYVFSLRMNKRVHCDGEIRSNLPEALALA